MGLARLDGGNRNHILDLSTFPNRNGKAILAKGWFNEETKVFYFIEGRSVIYF